MYLDTKDIRAGFIEVCIRNHFCHGLIFRGLGVIYKNLEVTWWQQVYKFKHKMFIF